MSIKGTIAAIRSALSPARISTFEKSVQVIDDEDFRALALYSWNARVSAALLAPLHVCEVVIRNAVSEAVEQVYGSRWPWQRAFELSLPDPRVGYSPRRDLQSARRNVPTTGKAIPELKFVFWQKMFTRRYDGRLWLPYLRQVLPNLDRGRKVPELRRNIYDTLEEIRKLRNRIAHHEPIFARNLNDDLSRIVSLVELRSKETAAWMVRNQDASTLLAETRTRPPHFRTAEAAYFMWLNRDGSLGGADVDWYLAERQLLGLL